MLGLIICLLFTVGVMTAAELEALFMSPPSASAASQEPLKLSKDKEWQLAFMTDESTAGRPIYGRHNSGGNRMTTVAELEANLRQSPPPPLPLPTAPQQDMAAFNKLLGLMQVKAAQQQQQQHIQQQLQQQVIYCSTK